MGSEMCIRDRAHMVTTAMPTAAGTHVATALVMPTAVVLHVVSAVLMPPAVVLAVLMPTAVVLRTFAEIGLLPL